MTLNSLPTQRLCENLDNFRILVVEDEFVIRLMLCEHLREVGYHVIEACNADEALVILEASVPQFIVTDVNMPGELDGQGLLAKVRELHPTLPVIVVSAHLPYFAGTDSYTQFMSKPYSFDALLENIQTPLERAV